MKTITMETTIYNIEKGHEFYSVFGDKINKYQYLCIYPSPNPEYETPENYHIILDKYSEKPIRIYHKNLTQILEENLKTYDDAKSKVKEYYKMRLKRFKDEF